MNFTDIIFRHHDADSVLRLSYSLKETKAEFTQLCRAAPITANIMAQELRSLISEHFAREVLCCSATTALLSAFGEFEKNSIDEGADNIHIVIRYSPALKTVNIVIIDDGYGFSPRHKGFYANTSQTRETFRTEKFKDTTKLGGAGRGMYMIAMIVQATGGSMYCANNHRAFIRPGASIRLTSGLESAVFCFDDILHAQDYTHNRKMNLNQMKLYMQGDLGKRSEQDLPELKLPTIAFKKRS